MRVDCRRSEKKKDENPQESSSSEPRTIQKQTNDLALLRIRMAAAKVFVCFCIVRGFEEEDSLENLHSVLFRLIKKRSV